MDKNKIKQIYKIVIDIYTFIVATVLVIKLLSIAILATKGNIDIKSSTLWLIGYVIIVTTIAYIMDGIYKYMISDREDGL